MIDKLRRRFIMIAMLSVFIVLSCITAFINLWNLANVYSDADATIATIIENDGHFPRPVKDKPKEKDEVNKTIRLPVSPSQSPEAPFSTRFFAVTLDNSGNELSANTGSIAAVDTEQALELAEWAVSNGKNKGTAGIYRFGVLHQADKTLVVFLDCGRDLHYLQGFLMSSLVVAAIGFTSVSLLIIIFSRAAVRPVATSYLKQKQFITDAGHELKTPLAIISAANEVLELEHGESEWTRSIANQTGRLGKLTEQLVSLTRMEEDSTPTMCSTDLCEVVEQAADAVQPIATAQGKQLVVNIEPSVVVTGNEQSLGQLTMLLLDNALKYSPSGAVVALSLATQGRHAELQVHNPTAAIEQGSHNELFERFYRSDSSRSSETGGYGLGLSIAQAIAQSHKATITARSDDGVSLTVTVRIPLHRG